MKAKSFALFGQPIAQSLSPRIHAEFARATGIMLDYRLIPTTAAEFGQRLERFAADGGTGANITQPLKELAYASCSTLAPAAHRAGVVNTLTRNADAWVGDNTDGAGLVHDLAERHGLDLRGRRTLILGAGGAAAGILPALLDAGIDSATLVNRTAAKAERLSERHGDPARVHVRYWQDVSNIGSFDCVIDATSAGHVGGALDLPFSIAGTRALAVTLSYGAAAARFLGWARAAGCTDVHDGLGMLVEQAAESFRLWHGVRPATETVYAALRADGGDAALLATD